MLQMCLFPHTMGNIPHAYLHHAISLNEIKFHALQYRNMITVLPSLQPNGSLAEVDKQYPYTVCDQ